MIIFINGSVNSGKSTISKLLAEKIGNCANVEIDSLRSYIEWLPLEKAIPINLKNTVDVIKNFVTEGLNVVVPYPLSQCNYDYFVENLKNINAKIYTFTLNPKIEKVLKNTGERELVEYEVERIKYHYNVGINNPNFGEIIDNTNQTPEETLGEILKKINI